MSRIGKKMLRRLKAFVEDLKRDRVVIVRTSTSDKGDKPNENK